ncbi:MAG: hypothetical protein QOE65_704 [Solirubrobacteraceae bacterium]|nr:hypothetical protein [Solirubrobacteraceae bacterium]
MPAVRGAALAAAVAVLAGCGGGGGTPPAGSGLASAPPIGRATCQDWIRSSPAVQQRTLEKIRQFVGGEITGRGAQGHGATLSDDDAGRLFHSQCSRPYAKSFLLYKLYTHAAAFIGR